VTSELDPVAVERRLQRLRERYVPETIEAGRRRLEADRPARTESFDQAVARRLTELRALCELTKVLGGATKRGTNSPTPPVVPIPAGISKG
jgi:hypothetical protein